MQVRQVAVCAPGPQPTNRSKTCWEAAVASTMRRNYLVIGILSTVLLFLVYLSSPRLFHDLQQDKGVGLAGNVFTAQSTLLKFASYYANHMVLQRNSSNIIWGYASRKYVGQDVTLTVEGKGTIHSIKSQIFANRVHFAARAVVTLDGSWSFQIGPRSPGGPFTITVSVGQASIAIHDVMFGDVWVCSGQSNMEFTASMMFNASEEIEKSAKYPEIRMMTVGMRVSNIPLYDFTDVEQPWSVASPKSVGGPDRTYFSAVCWEYGRHVYDKLKIPVGLVASTWGGTPIESWSSVDALHQCKEKSEKGVKLIGPATHSVLYNAMIHPLLNLTITGVVWYQGEANAGSSMYDCRFYALISDWRLKFHIGSIGGTAIDFPFGFVQLAPNKNVTKVGQFPSLRWQQTMNYGYAPNPDLKKVFMAVTVDLPDFSSPYGTIHPRDKETVSIRLAKAGLAIAYGKLKDRYMGPFPTAFYVDYNTRTLVIEVDRNKSSLVVRNLPGFEVCCDNEILCEENDVNWKRAELIKSNKKQKNNQLIISWKCSSNKIMGVRYLWSESPCAYLKCPVYSKDGYLPMPPFMFRGGLTPGRLTPDSNDLISKLTRFSQPT